MNKYVQGMQINLIAIWDASVRPVYNEIAAALRQQWWTGKFNATIFFNMYQFAHSKVMLNATFANQNFQRRAKTVWSEMGHVMWLNVGRARVRNAWMEEFETRRLLLRVVKNVEKSKAGHTIFRRLHAKFFQHVPEFQCLEDLRCGNSRALGNRPNGEIDEEEMDLDGFGVASMNGKQNSSRRRGRPLWADRGGVRGFRGRLT